MEDDVKHAFYAAAVAATLVLTAGAASAQTAYTQPQLGAQPQAAQWQAQQAQPQNPPHYEWRYHYSGHHPEYRGYWALVR